MPSTEIVNPDSWDVCNNNNEKISARREPDKDRLSRIAQEELRESDNAKNECLKSLREWIDQNADIENCLTDENFLLRFLRVKKFSIPMAQQTLLKYLNYRKKFPDIFYNMDCADSRVNELIARGYCFVSPFRDARGRRVIIYDTSKFDIQKFNGTDMAKVHAITLESLLCDEENQILGVTHVADLIGVTAQFVSLYSISEFAHLIRWGEQSFPMRHKEVHLLNMPNAMKYVYDFAKSNMSEKLKIRLKIHGALDQLHKQIDKSCLPVAFGGNMATEEMVRLWRMELESKRNRLLSFDRMNLISDQGIIRKKNKQAEDCAGSLPGSFRKLEFD